MKRPLLVLFLILLIGCKGEDRNKAEEKDKSNSDSIMESDISLDDLINEDNIELNLNEANKLAELPLACVNTVYPNKLGQTLGSEKDLKSPKELHPAFYGCFDWHSSVHAHWTLVKLLKHFPKLDRATEIKEALETSLSKENIQAEIAYFKGEHNTDYERTYGWAWLLKLTEELYTWDTDMGVELSENIKPLADLIVQRTTEFLPKLNYPIRVGEHTNTAFALSFAYDYAVATENAEFRTLIEESARNFYLKDKGCPMAWEPSGFDFLSPCLEEIDLMRKILPKAAFSLWMDNFMPQLKKSDFTLTPGEVSDRKDGKLVHLDGLNFSRAWVFYGLANKYPEDYSHLKNLADKHMQHSFPNLVGDSYEGGHWLGSFALYALQESKAKK
ncbi:DUF2891 domain-containing protein [Gillisia limnaea]|uniref:DUF2891 domain-containing protein n=1 Tax=Gillisia limnaea (strain DSM 15749 / LMG 21470 / R-8282) TaxID=865937 RepID=H2BRL7_GILLR|nr:DUF2891 domain-containing protein [Gillisia limnaea]EHQ01332.1 hypothetical protein Gilli_0620 [Gillisia limnaea DSM 15749]